MGVVTTWIGGARAVAQVQTVTVGSNTQNQTFTILLSHPSGGTSETVTVASYTAGAAESTTTIADALETLLNSGGVGTGTGSGTGLPNHEFVKAITVTQSGAVITFTANVSGVPFILTTGGTGTLTLATTTGNEGPNDWNTDGNWSTGTQPATTDLIYVSGTVPIKYGLNQSGIADFTSLTIRDYSGSVGHRGLPLRIDVATTLLVDCFGVAYIQLQSVTTECTVLNTGGSGSDRGLVFHNNLSAITRMRVYSGYVLLDYTVTSPAVTTLTMDGGDMLVDTCTLTTVNQTGGTLTFVNISNFTTMNIDAGDLYLIQHGNAGTVNQNGGNVFATFTVSITVTAWNLRGGVLDLTNARTALTITTLTMRQAARLLMDSSIVTASTFTREGVFEYRAASNSLARRTN